MEVILKENVQNLGYKDEVVKVKNGYGRNYLIPQKKAILATPSSKKMLEEELKQRAHKLAKIKADAEDMAAKLNGMSLTINAKASSTGKIFGAVTSIQVADALEQAGYKIDRHIIAIKGDIKEIGSYKAQLKLHKDVNAEISLEVVAE
jgi:large subunit ribosomal protein L9